MSCSSGAVAMPCSGPFRCCASALRHIWLDVPAGVIIMSQAGHVLGVTCGATAAVAPVAEAVGPRRGPLRFGSPSGESALGGRGAVC